LGVEKPSKGRVVNRRDLADMFGMSLPTIDAWVTKGCPFLQRGGRGREWQFNTADVVRWREEQAVAQAAPNAASMALSEIERATAEINLERDWLKKERERGQHIPFTLVAKLWGQLAGGIRSKLLALPAACQSNIPGFDRNAADQLKRLLYDALEDLANDGLPPGTTTTVEPGFGGFETTTNTDGSTVG
jgi:phage terminase Nu1 subunit (DNA packaging protein)